MGRDQAVSGVGTAGRPTPDGVAQAHEAMLANKSLQFDFTRIKAPERSEAPKWLGDLFEGLAPLLTVMFWVVLALVVIAILYFIAREIITVRFERHQVRDHLTKDMNAWRPSVEQAKVLLADADALAAEGRFAEAAHLLLLRGVQDIRDQRPGLLRPAFTSRDIAALEELSDHARRAFGAIASVVERSFFGGREVDAAGWSDCRRAYEDFALGRGQP